MVLLLMPGVWSAAQDSLDARSAGGLVALDIALEAPEVVAGLVLVSPSLFGYVPKEMPGYFEDLMVALRAGDFEGANEVLLSASIMSVPDGRKALVRRMVEENERFWTIPYSLLKLESPSAIERLGEIEAPTLILVGEKDEAAIRAEGDLLERGIAGARLVSIEGGGHLLNLTSPASFREALVGDWR